MKCFFIETISILLIPNIQHLKPSLGYYNDLNEKSQVI